LSVVTEDNFRFNTRFNARLGAKPVLKHIDLSQAATPQNDLSDARHSAARREQPLR